MQQNDPEQRLAGAIKAYLLYCRGNAFTYFHLAGKCPNLLRKVLHTRNWMI